MIDPNERNVGLTVNEYETLLMQNDLVDVLRNPLRFARIKAGNMVADPFSIPGKTLNYARYDVVRVLNSLMEALRLDEGSFERLVAKVMSLPARRFLRSRRVSFLAGSDREQNVPRLLRGTYQSPILVQWQPAEKQERHLDIVIVQFSSLVRLQRRTQRDEHREAVAAPHHIHFEARFLQQLGLAIEREVDVLLRPRAQERFRLLPGVGLLQMLQPHHLVRLAQALG